MANYTENNLFITTLIDLYSAPHEVQVFYLPIELMHVLRMKTNDIICIKEMGKGVIGEVYPNLDSYCHSGFQVFISCNVIDNVSHIMDFKMPNEIKVNIENIITLRTMNTRSVDIDVIMNSAEGVLKGKKFGHFPKDLQSLLKLYKFTNPSIIKCSSNPLAKLLGIAYIVIKDIIYENKENEMESYVGEISASTIINILKMESQERHLFLINNPTLLGGLNHILEDLKSFLNDPWDLKEEFTDAGVTYPSGVLLIGPPGCGKSSLVRQLCHETQSCLIATSGTELQSPYEGEALRNLAKVAKKACLLSKEGKCLFFIDEIDSICPARTQESKLQDLQLTAQVLLTLDECKSYPHLLVMAATNRPFALDPAVRRSGRLEIEILLNSPTLEERKEILHIHSNDLPLTDDVLSEIASATPGFVGADLQLVCERAREALLPHESTNNLKNASQLDPSDLRSTMLSITHSITPSIHKTLEFITTKPNPSPVGGLDHIKEKLSRLLTHHIKYAEFYDTFRLQKPKGILLYGPRGCGKTRLVSLLASQRGFTFLSANASHLLSPFVGESEKRVAALFHSARQAQPSIVFIDEIDGIFGTRDSSSVGGVRVNLLTELLQAMDGADVAAMSLQGSSRMGNTIKKLKDNVVVCASTNNPQRLDSALLRPGRFDHVIYVPPPDTQARFDILKLKSCKLKVSEETLRRVAEKSDGWTGAELENLITQVATQSVTRGHFSEETNEIYVTDDVLMSEFCKMSPTLTSSELKYFEDFEKKFCCQSAPLMS